MFKKIFMTLFPPAKSNDRSLDILRLCIFEIYIWTGLNMATSEDETTTSTSSKFQFPAKDSLCGNFFFPLSELLVDQ